MINSCYIINDNRLKSKVEFSNSFISNFYKFNDMQDILFPAYTNLKWNSHHWTYDYVYKNFIPILANDLDIKFNLDDYNIVNNIVGDSDLSYLVPKLNKNMAVHLIDDDIFIKGNDDVLRKPIIRTYHDIFIGAHKVVQIHNYDYEQDKVLLLNCDSMCAPIVPILARHYKYILHLDNRLSNKTHADRIKSFIKNDCDRLTILIAGPGMQNISAEDRYKHNLI